MKKILPLCLLAVSILGLCGCHRDYSSIQGYDVIMQARKQYAELNGGHLTVKDEERNLITQDFTFTYDSDGTLMYSYFGTDGTTKYYEYHNGKEYDYTENGEWKTVELTSPNYVFYTKDNRNSLTAQTALMFIPDGITSSTVEQTEQGAKYTYVYDASSLSTSQLGETGKLLSFSTEFVINKEGYCTSLSQKGTIDKDGAESKVNYTMTIDMMNDVSEIKRPEISSVNSDSNANTETTTPSDSSIG